MSFFKQKMAALALLLCVMMLASNSLAVEAEAADREQGRALMERGVEAMKAERLQEARTLFEQSLDVYPSFDVAGNLGLVEAKLGLWSDAANHLDYCLRHFPSGESERLRGVIRDAYDEARKRVGRVEVVVNVDGATIIIGKRNVGLSPLRAGVFVDPGRHGVRVQKGELAVESTFLVEAGQSERIQLQLVPKDVPPSPAVVSPQRARNATGEQPPPSDEQSRQSVTWIPAYALAGVTVATLGTSLLLRGLANRQANQAQGLLDDLPSPQCSAASPPDECGDIRDHRERYNALAKASNGTLIAAGALGAATVGYVIYAAVRTPKRSQPALSILPLRSGAFVSVQGAF